MVTYVFFNRRTGAIVHTHEEVAVTGESLSVPREELKAGALFNLLEDRVDRQDVEVLEVTQNTHLLRRSFSEDSVMEPYIDVEQQVLSERKKGGER
jgi:hypothetical protein